MGYKGTNPHIIGFEVLMAVTNRIVDFWDVTPCGWGPLDQMIRRRNLEDHNLNADGGAISLQVFIRQSRVQTVWTGRPCCKMRCSLACRLCQAVLQRKPLLRCRVNRPAISRLGRCSHTDWPIGQPLLPFNTIIEDDYFNCVPAWRTKGIERKMDG